MAEKIKRIGILTGGGDCPGLNAVIRAVVKPALRRGIEVIGINDGFLGVIEDRMHPLVEADVSNILTHGGTILGSSNKANPRRFATGVNPDGTPIFEDKFDDCIRHLDKNGIEALMVLGGDGTMSAAQSFIEHGVPCLGVPKTIDNDIMGTELTFGFMTAVHIATEALDRVSTTAASHHRAIVVEVMGRNAGWIALYSGIASGSDVILIPEIPFDINVICDTIKHRFAKGKHYTVICVAEGAKAVGGEQIVDRVDPTSPDPIRLGGIGEWVAKHVEDQTGIESRSVTLGHVQRGGTPTAIDRVVSTQFGSAAERLLYRGELNRMVALQGGVLADIDIREVAHKQRTIWLDHPLLAAARGVLTTFGDTCEV